MKGCVDYASVLGWSHQPGYLFAQCCTSCHEDEDEYGYELCTVWGDNGEEGLVCCAVLRALEEAPVIGDAL